MLMLRALMQNAECNRMQNARMQTKWWGGKRSAEASDGMCSGGRLLCELSMCIAVATPAQLQSVGAFNKQ
jgi:hypothetical protein